MNHLRPVARVESKGEGERPRQLFQKGKEEMPLAFTRKERKKGTRNSADFRIGGSGEAGRPSYIPMRGEK